MTKSKFSGTGVALVTPFKADGSIDFTGLEKLINHCIKDGVEYLVSLGTTGESVTLSKEEKMEVLEFTIAANKGRVPLVAGFGGHNTEAIIQDLKHFHFKGVDAILSVSPYYNKPSQEGIYRHFKAIAAASPVPVILYNVPARTGSNIAAETTLRLATEPNIIGIKEASGNFAQCMVLAKHRPEGFLLLSGDDNITLPLLALGFDGVISVAGQAFTRVFTDMVRYSLAGDFVKARMNHYQLLEVTDLLFAEGNPAGIKAALSLLGICEDHVRLPLVAASDGLRARIEGEILKYRF